MHLYFAAENDQNRFFKAEHDQRTYIYIYRTPGKSSPEKRTPTKEREREGEQ